MNIPRSIFATLALLLLTPLTASAQLCNFDAETSAENPSPRI